LVGHALACPTDRGAKAGRAKAGRQKRVSLVGKSGSQKRVSLNCGNSGQKRVGQKRVQKRVSLNCGNSVLPTDEIPHEISHGSG
jgi:hypothetical protein